MKFVVTDLDGNILKSMELSDRHHALLNHDYSTQRMYAVPQEVGFIDDASIMVVNETLALRLDAINVNAINIGFKLWPVSPQS